MGSVRPGTSIVTVDDGISKWLEVCEKEGRDGRDPVRAFTLKGYKYRARIINKYSWPENLHVGRHLEVRNRCGASGKAI